MLLHKASLFIIYKNNYFNQKQRQVHHKRYWVLHQ